METVTYHSALSEAELLDRVEKTTRPWSRMDLWTARNTCFHREGKGGLRLVWTGEARGYVFADLNMTTEETGTQVTVVFGIPRTIYGADAAICALFLGNLLLSMSLHGNVIQALLTLWVPPLFLWLTHRLRRSLPRLKAFVEEELLEVRPDGR